MKMLMAIFALFIIAMTMLGFVAPDSWANMVISTGFLAGVIRLSLAGVLLTYVLFDGIKIEWLKTALMAYGLGLAVILGIYILDTTNLELRIFDLFFVAEGSILALLASFEYQPNTEVKPAPQAKPVPSGNSVSSKRSFAFHNHIKLVQ